MAKSGTLFGKPRGSVVKHPGALRRAAERNGRSTEAEAEVESHSSSKKLRARGNLAKAFETMRSEK
ncbi:MAG: hypothetical protein KGL39_38495 [Patescibacteria group bacterium]|nr:hypothetical protein [Patescibacteria group bacterium]